MYPLKTNERSINSMFYKAAKCDRCGKESRASKHETTRVSYPDRKKGTRIYYDLCNDCLNNIVAEIVHYGEGTHTTQDDEF